MKKHTKSIKKQSYKTSGKQGLFDTQFATEQLSEIGNSLERMSSVIDFEVFRNPIYWKRSY
jgi:hypothetical protein